MSLRAFYAVLVSLLTIGGNACIADSEKNEGTDPVIRAALAMVMPASGVRQNGEYVGFEVDLINALIEGYDPPIEVQFVDAPNWTRSLDSIRYGQLDLLSLVSFRENRKGFMDYIAPSGIEAAYLITREDQEIGSLETLDELAIKKDFILIDSTIAWNEEFDDRIKKDAEFASNFVMLNGARASSIADIDRLQRDPAYRKSMESPFPDIYEDGNVSLGSIAERVSMGTIGGYIIVHYQVSPAIRDQKKRIERGGLGVPLKATRIKAFKQETTYLVASRKTPSNIRSHMKARYKEMLSSGAYQKLWNKWYGEVNLPETADPNDL